MMLTWWWRATDWIWSKETGTENCSEQGIRLVDFKLLEKAEPFNWRRRNSLQEVTIEIQECLKRHKIAHIWKIFKSSFYQFNAGVYILKVGLFFPQPGSTRVYFFPYFISSLSTFDTFYSLKMGQHAYKTLAMPKNHRFMPKIARKTPNFAFFHLFLAYFFPQTGPRPIFLPPPPSAFILKYIHPWFKGTLQHKYKFFL